MVNNHEKVIKYMYVYINQIIMYAIQIYVLPTALPPDLMNML
jgi:hypothetical protein